jgi:hypothetical protein
MQASTSFLLIRFQFFHCHPIIRQSIKYASGKTFLWMPIKNQWWKYTIFSPSEINYSCSRKPPPCCMYLLDMTAPSWALFTLEEMKWYRSGYIFCRNDISARTLPTENEHVGANLSAVCDFLYVEIIRRDSTDILFWFCDAAISTEEFIQTSNELRIDLWSWMVSR